MFLFAETKCLTYICDAKQNLNIMTTAFNIGDKVRFDRIQGEYRGIFHDNIAMVLTDDGARLYYIDIQFLERV